MVACRDIAREDSLYTAFLQCFELVEAVNVMGCQFTIDLDLDCIESKVFVLFKGYKYSNLGVGRI